MKLIKWVIAALITITIPLTIIILTGIIMSYLPDQGRNVPKIVPGLLGFSEASLFLVFGYFAGIFTEWFDSKLK